MSYPPTDDTKGKPLTAGEKTNWNRFIGFVEANNMKGNPILDQRNKQVGYSLLQKFNLANPKDALPLDIVPKVQQNLQDYRSDLINQWKAGKLQTDAKTEDEIMPGLSPVDSWPGSKTLSHRFPTAQVTVTTPTSTTVKNYGVNTDGFDRDRGVK